MYESNLSRMRQNKKAQAVAATIAALSLETAILNNAYAADDKPTAPLEERLDKAPKMPVPEILKKQGKAYDPKMPEPFAIDRFYIPSQAAKGAEFNRDGRAYTGSFDINGKEYTLKFIIGLKESGKHRAVIYADEQDIINSIPFEDGSEIYMSGNVGIAQFRLPDGSRLYGLFDYLVDDSETDPHSSDRKIDTPIGMRATRGVTIGSEVRGGKDLKGKILLDSGIVCEGQRRCYELPKQKGHGSDKLSTDSLLEDRVDHVRTEVKNMIDAGCKERDVLAYTSQAKRKIAAELTADLNDNQPNLDRDQIELVPLIPPETRVHNSFQAIYTMIEDTYATPEVIGQSPLENGGMEGVTHPDLVGVKTEPAGEGPDKKAGQKPADKPADKPEGLKIVGPIGPKKVDLNPPVPNEDILEAVPYTPPEDPEPDTGDDEWYEEWWFWTIVGGVVAAGVGTGLGVYLSQDSGGGEPQPPVGTPTMQPWDKF